MDLLNEFWDNFKHNLFKPLLLFFYMGFSVPLLKVPFEFPHIIYQGLTIYLLIAIGWHGGEELADLNVHDLAQAGGFMAIGFVMNFIIGCIAYLGLPGPPQGDETAEYRRGHGGGLLRLRLRRHIRDLRGRADRE
ncbi:MAG TPA: sodium-dependent bicarbonate transport family permease [Pirellulales bacterium]|nr:sodium-dependent bicarbonate transport family permease [Pirellulales bacterium]